MKTNEVFDKTQFNYMADSNGYMITYRGRPIGGAGVKLPRDKPLRGKQAQKNREEFAANAKHEIEQLKAGCGQARFWANVHMIEHTERETSNLNKVNTDTATN